MALVTATGRDPASTRIVEIGNKGSGGGGAGGGGGGGGGGLLGKLGGGLKSKLMTAAGQAAAEAK